MQNHGSNKSVKLQSRELAKDLGVSVDTSLTFLKHFEIQVNKANMLLGLVRRSFVYLDSQTMKMLFITIVQPHLEFET